MADQKIYDKTIVTDGNQLRIVADRTLLYIYFNSDLLFTATYQQYATITQPFNIETDGKLTSYVITFLFNAYAKCLVSKNGWLIYSDDPGISVFDVERVIDHLFQKE